MRSDDEDDDEEFEDENEENEEDEDEGLDARANAEDDQMEFYEEDGSADDNEDEEGEGDEDDDEDEDDDNDNDNDNDEDEDEDEDENDDDEDEDRSEDGDDVDMANGDDEAGSSHPSQASKLRELSPDSRPKPPHLVRRSLFIPGFTSPPSSLSVEAVVAIPLPCPVYSIASTACSSYLLTGAQDGYIRAYDFWSSVNGGQVMTAQQRTIVGLGEGVSKAGVPRGWWGNEVEGAGEGSTGKRLEAVYSLAMEGDGLWALTGTQSGPINLYTVRHSPGHLVHSLKGHTNVVSAMTLLPNEKGFLSGSWDGSVREWDLNTGQTVRTYPTHGAQISSLSFRPHYPMSPTPSPAADADGEEGEGKLDVSVNVGPDFFTKQEYSPEKDKENGETGAVSKEGEETAAPTATEGDIDMADKPSPYDPLFDDDADGEDVLPSGDVTMGTTPTINDMAPPSPPKTKGPSLALPGIATNGTKDPTAPSSGLPSQPSSASTPLFNIPHQANVGTSRQAAAQIPLLSPASWKAYSDDVLLTSSMDGQVVLLDRRIPDYGTGGVGRLMPGEKTPPWCMSACWSGNGTQVLAGRRNGTVDIWDLRRSSSSSAPNILRTLRTPAESGVISCIIGMPDGKHVATASQDNIRLWNTSEYFTPEESIKKNKSKPPFKIIAGHHGGTISSMLVDPTCRFLVTASGDRGWQGESTKVVLIHEIKW